MIQFVFAIWFLSSEFRIESALLGVEGQEMRVES